jgi:hypothetical protein
LRSPKIACHPDQVIPSRLDAGDLEVRQLLSFVDGAIVIPEARQYLWRSWGFCPRHTWLATVVECEMRLRPFGTSIVYQDLATRAGKLLGASWVSRSAKVQRLFPQVPCPTCDYLAAAGFRPGWAEPTEYVNRRKRTVQLLTETEEQWRPQSCPTCLGGTGPVCRPHLLQGDGSSVLDIGSSLAELAGQLHSYYKSLSWEGYRQAPRNPAALVQVLGWFAGWSFADTLLAHGRL